MKIVLMGTNSWVVPVFERISQLHHVIAVFTKTPAPSGRKMILQNSPVHDWANAKGLPVFTDISEYNFTPDFIVVASYGVILKSDVLSSAPAINIHPSQLPKYRGPSPMLTAIYNGDEKTAVCLMQIAPELDAGDILMRRDLDIDINDNNNRLEEKVSIMSADMLEEYLNNPQNYPPQKQVGEISHTKKFKKSDMDIDWNNAPIKIHNQIRSIGGRTKINGLIVKIIQTKINEAGDLEILKLQPAGKSVMDWKSFVNGQRGIINIGE